MYYVIFAKTKRGDNSVLTITEISVCLFRYLFYIVKNSAMRRKEEKAYEKEID